jgi:MFS family permease
MNRNLLLVAISLFIWGTGEGLFFYFQPIYLQELHADPLMIGSILGGMGIAMAAAQIPAGYLSDRFGSRTIMWGSWILGTLSAWVMAMASSLPGFVVGLILYGLTSFVLAPMNSYITSVRGNLSVGRSLTFASGLYNVGAVLGPFAGGLIADKLGLKSVYMMAGILFLVSTLVILFVSKVTDTHLADLDSTNTKGLLKNTRFMGFLGITLITVFVLYLPSTFTPNYLQNQQEFSKSTIGVFGTFANLGNAVAVLALGGLRASTAFIISQVWVLIFTIAFLVGNLPAWFGIGYFFYGGFKLCRAMILTIARSLIHPGETGLAYGMVETASAIAVILAPILAGILYATEPLLIYKVPLYAISGVIILNVIGLTVMRRNNAHASAN